MKCSAEGDLCTIVAYQELFDYCGLHKIEVLGEEDGHSLRERELLEKAEILITSVRRFIQKLPQRWALSQKAVAKPGPRSGKTLREPTKPLYLLRLERGVVWRLRFGGNETTLKKCLALRYVNHLLKHSASEPIYGVELAHRALGVPVIEQRNLGLDDKESYQALRKKIIELRQTISDPNASEIEKREAEDQLQDIADSGRLRGSEGAEQKKVRAIRQAIRRLVRDLERQQDGKRRPDEVARSFAEHVRRFIMEEWGQPVKRHPGDRAGTAAGCFIYLRPPGVKWTD